MTSIRTTSRKLSDAAMNIARRLKYQQDAAYRAKVLARGQEYKTALALHAPHNADYNVSLRRLAQGGPDLTRYGRVRKRPDQKSAVLCFSVEELAGALDRHPETVRAWLRAGYLLPPDLPIILRNGHDGAAFSLARAKKILAALAFFCNGKAGQLRARIKTPMRKMQT